MNNSNCVWECLKCELPNFSSSLFDLHSISTFNSFSALSDTSDQLEDSDALSPGVPLASSSPEKKQNSRRPKLARPLQLLNVNCQSLVNKKEKLEHLLDSTKVDIVIGTESWLDNSIKDHEVFPSGFTIYRKDRKNGKGGGVFIAVREDIMSSHMPDFDSECEIIWVKVDIVACKSLYIAAYYRPNANDQESLNSLAASLDKLPKKTKHVWLGGDMNLPGIDWPSGTLKTNCPTPGQHNQFLEILADHGLSQMTDKPTRESNVLDLLAVDNRTLLNRLKVIPGISDHDIVFAELDILPKKHKQRFVEIPPEKIDFIATKVPSKNSTGAITFEDYPEFRPNMTPKEVLQSGSFGGTYFRPIESSVTGKHYTGVWKELPKDWISKLDCKRQVASSTYHENVNTYGVKCGGCLEMWEESGWMHPQDPYGWFQWYCRFYQGRRTDDDQRQIGRWLRCAGITGRWRNNLFTKIAKSGCGIDNKGISPVVRQTLQHWGYKVTQEDYNAYVKKKKL